MVNFIKAASTNLKTTPLEYKLTTTYLGLTRQEAQDNVQHSLIKPFRFSAIPLSVETICLSWLVGILRFFGFSLGYAYSSQFMDRNVL